MTDPDATTVRPIRAPPGDADATALRPSPKRHPAAQAARAPKLPVTPLALPEGFRLLEYRIERVLGHGGFGITYLATDVHLHAQVAIKEFAPEEIAMRAGDHSVWPNAPVHRERYRQGLENFLAEARTLASFRHPNIVRVARFFEAHSTAYMVLEYERGMSLRKWWPAQPANGERGLIDRLQPLLDGLATVHEAGYLHRDIKPDNIQVREGDGRFVLLDFGSAGQTVALADCNVVVVTPGYAPLEQYGVGEQGAWTDIYAMAATLYWAVSGNKPPDAEARASGEVMLSAGQAGRGRFGPAFLAAIDWALQADPAQRPRSIDEWRRKLVADHSVTLGLREALRHGELPDVQAARMATAARWQRLAALRKSAAAALRPADWPLAVKITLALLAAALLPMLATAFYNLYGAQTALQASQLRQTELMAHSTAGRLAQLLGDSANLARSLGTDADFARWLSPPVGAVPGASNDDLHKVLNERLIGLARANRDVHLVMLMDAAGITRLSSDPSLLGRNFSFRQYFREAITGRPFVTGIVVGAAAGAAGVFFSEPVRGPGGKVLGAVVLRIRASSFAAIVDDARHDGDMTPFLIDSDGVLVHHPRPELLYRSLVPLTDEAQARIKADQRFRLDRIDSLREPELAAAMLGPRSTGHVAYHSGISGADEIAGYARVPGHQWVVGVSETRESFEQPLQRLFMHLLVSVALAGLIFTALALRFSRSLISPIKALTDSANALKAGDFDRAQVSVSSRDEVGQLARTFNIMVDVLRQREREREARRG